MLPAKALGCQGRWRDWGCPSVQHGHGLWPRESGDTWGLRALRVPHAALGVDLVQPQLSAEAVGERMYGNPIGPAVPKAGKGHVVRNISWILFLLRVWVSHSQKALGSHRSLTLTSEQQGNLTHVDARNDTRIALKKQNLGCDS